MPSPVVIEQHTDAEHRVVRVRGELDFVTAPQLEHALAAAVRTGHVVLLDLSDVSFFSAAALHAVARAQRRGAAPVRIVASRPVQRVLDLVPDAARPDAAAASPS